VETPAPPQLLSDEALARFLREGYVTVPTGLPRQFHEELRHRLADVLEEEGNWGNNVLPRVPELQLVWDDPVVRGALTSILGPTYVAHPHRYCHLNVPGSEAQRLHKDTLNFSGDRQPPHHRPRWAIAFYYPQDVTADMGPTGIVPGSQYYLDQPDASELPEITARGPAGTVTIVHFDIWHRATANTGTRPRLMVKFEFGRMDEPGVAPGLPEAAAWPGRGDGSGGVPHHGLWSHLWRWLHGRAPDSGGAPGDGSGGDGDAGRWERALRSAGAPERRRAADALGLAGPAAREALPALAQALQDGDEAVRLNAAYALGALGGPAVPVLAEALRTTPEPLRRYAGYGLSAAGAPAVEALTGLAQAPDEPARRAAVDALGDMGAAAAPAVPVLAGALRDESQWVRRQAAEALGTIGAAGGPAVEALAGALRDEQPFVRFNAALALARIGPAAAEAVPALAGTLADSDRYTRGWALLALRRIATPEATDILLDHLMTGRWCPITTTGSRY
jgi:HEAT repeat protein